MEQVQLNLVTRKGCFIQKARHWEHVDGSLWWRNPESNTVEPYHEESTESTGQSGVKVNNAVVAEREDTTGVTRQVTATTWYGQDKQYLEEFNTQRGEYYDISSGINKVFAVNFNNSTGVFKPLSMEYKKDVRHTIDLKGVKQGIREVLAYKLDQVLGLNVVPPTTMVSHTVANSAKNIGIKEAKVKGSMQLYVKGGDMNAGDYLNKAIYHNMELPHGVLQGLCNMQLLDLIMCNTDRHTGNFLINPVDQRVYAIDNGLTFPRGESEKRTDFYVRDLTFQFDKKNDGQGGLTNILDPRDARIIDRSTRNQLLSVTKDQFMGAFNGVKFTLGEAKQAYMRFENLQKSLKKANDMDDLAVEEHISGKVDEEIGRLKAGAKAEAGPKGEQAEMFREDTLDRDKRIEGMRDAIRQKLFNPKKKG